MASLIWWTWVSVHSRSWWWTGRPGMLRFMGSQRVGHDWETDLIWSDLISVLFYAHLCLEFSLGISNSFEEISSLSHSIVFLYFSTLITEAVFLICPCSSMELCIQMGISFLFFFAFCIFSFFLFFFLWGLLQQPSCLFAFLFLGDGLDPYLMYNVMNLIPLFFRHSVYQI